MKGRADIYVAFFEAAMWQLRPGGICAFICADRWMLNQYGSDSKWIRRSAGHHIAGAMNSSAAVWCLNASMTQPVSRWPRMSGDTDFLSI